MPARALIRRIVFVSIGVDEHAGRDCNEQWISSIAMALRPGGSGLICHYHRSADQWLVNFETNWPRIHALDPARFDEKFRKAWLFTSGERPRPSRRRARSSTATTSRS